MSHQEQRNYCLSVKKRFPEYFQNKRVLDVGSLDVNGTNRFLFTDCEYIGLDVVPGSNVDVVMPCHKYVDKEGFDTIISTECLEHDLQWMLTLTNIERLLRSGGLFLFTAATTGRAEHGTVASTPQDCPGLPWNDYYRNLTEHDVRWRLDGLRKFVNYEFAVNNHTHDLYGWMIKR